MMGKSEESLLLSRCGHHQIIGVLLLARQDQLVFNGGQLPGQLVGGLHHGLVTTASLLTASCRIRSQPLGPTLYLTLHIA